jgi:tetratricopeptide (TPR) repeat protein
VIAVAALCSMPHATLAQPAREEALDLFEQAEDRYREGDLTGAIELLTRARSLHPEPVLLYNLARAYEGLGRFDEALEAYRQYLVEHPEARDRGAIERRITSLSAELEERRRLEQARDARPSGEPDGRDGSTPAARSDSLDDGPGALPWVVAGVGVAALGAGVVVAFVAEGKRGDAEDDPFHATARESFRDAQSIATVANVLIVGGGIVTAVGIVWLVSASGGDRTGASVAFTPSSVSVRGTFW